MEFLSNNNTLTKTTTGHKYEYKSNTIWIVSLEHELTAKQFQFISHIRDVNAEFVHHDSAGLLYMQVILEACKQ